MAGSSNSPGPRARLALEALEDRTTPVFLPQADGASTLLVNNIRVPVGGASIAVADIVPEGVFNLARNEYITGTGPGREGLVRIWDNNGSLLSQFVPFPGFKGGINVAAGDVLGDGAPEIIASIAANGPPHVKIFSAAGRELASFYAFTDASGAPSYLGGINIATGNVLNEGPGGPDEGVLAGGRRGGNNASLKDEIIVGSAGGGIPGHVKVFDAAGREFRSFNPFEGGFLGGVSVAAASVDANRTPGSSGGGGGGRNNRVRDTNSYDEVIVGATDGAPHVKVFSTWQSPLPIVLQSYFAFDPGIGRGITVAAGNTDGNRAAEIYTALIGDANTGAPIRVFNSDTGLQRAQFLAFPTNYSRAVNMAVGNVTNFDPRDDDDPVFGNNGNTSFLTQDLVVTAGDGPYEQIPRVFFGRVGSPAGLNGPP